MVDILDRHAAGTLDRRGRHGAFFLGALDALFDFTKTGKRLVELASVGRAKRSLQAFGIVEDKIQNAAVIAIALGLLRRVAAAVFFGSEEPLEHQTRVNLGGIGLARRTPGDAVAIGAAITEDLIADTSVMGDWFATMPALPVVSSQQLPDEEELHTSFEQAISDRLLIVNQQLSLRSGPLADIQQVQVPTAPLKHVAPDMNVRSVFALVLPPTSAWLGNMWQRSVIFVSLALMLMLTGFDLMGLLVLHAH